VKDVPIKEFDSHGLGVEPNNLTAIKPLKGYRALRYGQAPGPDHYRSAQLSSADPYGDPSLESSAATVHGNVS
jgi:hypothetical protein